MKNFYELTPEEKIPLLKEYMEHWIDNYQTEPKIIGPDDMGITYTVMPCNAFSLPSFPLWYDYKRLKAGGDSNWAILVPFSKHVTIGE